MPLLLGSFAVAWFIVVMQLLWRFVGDIVGKGVDAIVLLELMFYAAMTVAPIALVLGVLLGALMTFGNLGERLELLAMKSAGISLVRIFKPLFLCVTVLALGLFVFQNDLMITSQVRFWQYYFSIKNKSPELAIPAGVFYKDIEGYSIYVAAKDKETQLLYDVMIYDYKEGFQNAAVITADSGRLYTTNNGTLFVLELYNGESFRNLRKNANTYGSSNALIPYMRETFTRKEVHIPFDASLDMVDEGMLSRQFVGKNMFELKAYTDSLGYQIDSVAAVNRRMVLNNSYMQRMHGARRDATVYAALSNEPRHVQPPDSDGSVTVETPPVREVAHKVPNHFALLPKGERRQYDMSSILAQSGMQARKRFMENAQNIISTRQSDIYFSNVTQDEMMNLKKKNEFEYWRKFTYPVAVIVFFLIGAPLGSVIRKGGLGVPFIVGVFCFIIFYILESTGMKLARDGRWEVWCGMWLPNMVLLPLGIWLCYVATKDSTRLNLDTYTNWFRHVMGLNTARKVGYKSDIRHEADLYQARTDVQAIRELADMTLNRGRQKYYQFYLRADDGCKYRQHLDDTLDRIVHNLENARDYLLVHRVGSYPYLHRLAHVYRPQARWLRVLLMIFFPAGLLLYAHYIIRQKAYMRELSALKNINNQVSEEIERILSRHTSESRLTINT